MTLRRDSVRGLWTRADWETDQSGLFALVVGVSEYDHLPGGKGPPADESYGLEQLPASALSACRFFDWLIKDYRLDGLPVVRARLLLSPRSKGEGNATTDELRDCDPQIVAHAAGATFSEFSDAVALWYADMKKAGGVFRSRSLFFFSGHGLEIRSGHQVLLPSDYLRPPQNMLNNAISTRNLIDCLPFLPEVPSHILMLDGCRNDVDDLRSSRVEGAEVLNLRNPGATNPHYEQSVLSATTSGLKAYSPRDGGLSLFTHAMMDGLTNKPAPKLGERPLRVTRRAGVRTVQVNKLASYMKGRVDALIKNASSDVLQVVRAEISSPDPDAPVEVTELSARLAEPSKRSATRVEMADPDRSDAAYGEAADPVRTPRPPREAGRRSRPPTPTNWFAIRYPQVVQGGPWRAPSIGGFHSLFRSEAITYPWVDTLQVVSTTTGRVLPPDVLWIHAVRHAPSREGLNQVQVHFTLRPGAMLTATEDEVYLLTIRDTSSRQLACLLPVGPERDAKFQLEIDVGPDRAGRHSFLRFAAYLSQDQPGQLGRAAKIWDELRAEDAATAIRLFRKDELARLEALLREKVVSPVSALVAGLTLLKANRFDRMHDWTRNLANWFEWLPDGVALWTEQRRRQGKLSPKVASWFVDTLSQRNLPLTSEGFALAASVSREVALGRTAADPEAVENAKKLYQRFDAAMPLFRDWGLFATYVNWSSTASVLDALTYRRRG